MGTEKSRIALLYVTERGKAQGEKISGFLPIDISTRLTKEALHSLWPKVDQIIIIGSLGIATRYVAPLVKDKAHDPGVVVVDEWGRFSVSLLSGHLGGANRLALTLGHRLNARPVITTSSDLIGLYPPDLWALDNQLVVEDKGGLKDISQRLIDQGYLKVYLEGVNLGMPEHYIKTADPKEADLIVSFRDDPGFLNRPLLRPKVLYVGIGFNSGTRGERIYECLKEVFIRNGLSLLSVDSLATIDKKREDPHLSRFLEDYGLSCRFYTPEELNRVEIRTPSEGVYGSVGAYGVSEPAAILASKGGRLLVPKTKFGDVTVSVALKGTDEKRGRLNVVGIGPGGIEYLLPIA
ncbi:MAG: cobalt-precorrin 5A hydrolase, partial [Desulfatiglandales bacterium]